MSYNNRDWNENEAKRSLSPMEEDLPYVTLEPESVLTFKDGSIAGGLEYFPPHLDLWGNQDVNTLQRTLADIVNSLPEGMKIQWELFSSTDVHPVTERHFKTNTKEVLKDDLELFEIERRYRETYCNRRAKEGTLRHWRSYVYLNYKEPRSTWQSPKGLVKDTIKELKNAFSGKAVVQEEDQAYRDRLKQLVRAIEQIEGAFVGMGWHPRVLQESDWCNLLFQIMNPKLFKLGAAPQLPTEDNRDFCSTFLLSQCKENENGGGFELDGHHHRILTLAEIKAGFTVFGLLRRLTQSGIPNLRVVVTGTPCEPDHYLKQIRREIKGARYRLERNPDDERISQEIRERLTEQQQILQGNQKIFEAKITLHLWHESKEIVERYASQFVNIGQQMGGARWLEESFNAVPYFYSALPGWTNDKDSNRLNEFKTYTYVDMIPAFGQFDCTAGLSAGADTIQSPVLLENSEMGLCGWAPMDAQRGINLNGIVVGRIRSGKSVGTTTINTMMMPMKARLVCIDLGKSSKTLIEARDGVYYQIIDDKRGADGVEKVCRINPFGGFGRSKQPTDDDIIDMVYVIERMLIDHNESELKGSKKATLTRAIQNTFRNRPGQEIFVRHLYATLLEMRDNPDARDMANILQNWANHGPYARFVDGPTDVDLDNPAIGFELLGLEKRPELLPVIVAIILSIASRTAERYPGVPKMLVVDEFGVLGKNKSLARFVEIAYRTYGKTGTGVWTISQQLGDYELCSEGGNIETLLNNTGQFLIFAQAESALPAIRACLKLPEAAIQQIANLESRHGQYAEALLVCKQQIGEPKIGKVVFRANPLQYWITSTTKNDMDVRDAYITRFLHMEQKRSRAVQRAVLALADEMPNGFNALGIELNPRRLEAMAEPQAGDELPWDPYQTEFAKYLDPK